jgi:hypothetical protein
MGYRSESTAFLPIAYGLSPIAYFNGGTSRNYFNGGTSRLLGAA